MLNTYRHEPYSSVIDGDYKTLENQIRLIKIRLNLRKFVRRINSCFLHLFVFAPLPKVHPAPDHEAWQDFEPWKT
jgi:hypothetical protein